MSNRTDIQQMKEELKRIQEHTQKSRRRAAFGFGVLILAALFSFGYAFVNRVAAEKYAEESLRLRQLYSEMEKRTLKAEADLIRERDLAEYRGQQLKECKESRK
jgi:predicted negative regulator of RcsB-dependent stress response